MALKEKIVYSVKKIKGGAELPNLKVTAENPSVIMPPPTVVKIPLSQHIGSPATPTVKKGDKVFVGTLIGKASRDASVPVHSSVSGTVQDIKTVKIDGKNVKCVIIESDGAMENDPDLTPVIIKTKKDIIKAAKACGLIGEGFQSLIKLNSSKNFDIDTLIINGAECEPYITADYRECMEFGEDIIEAAYLLKDKLKIKDAIIGIGSDKPKAVEGLSAIAADKQNEDNTVKIMELPERYPHGESKAIVYSATGRIIKSGKLPVDVGCIVLNITSVATLYRYIKTGMPLVSKRITVDGDGINNPMNVIVPIGTAVKDVLEFAGGMKEGSYEVICGGSMTGTIITDTEAVIEKCNNAILVLPSHKNLNVTACIHCGRCADSCIMGLYPFMVETALNKGLTERLESLSVGVCIECGCCSFVCPAKHPLTQIMRDAKSELGGGKNG